MPQSTQRLYLSDIPSLVELPASFRNFTELLFLGITDCTNLETLHTGINFQHLFTLDLSGCSRLRSFPDISTNLYMLNLSRTGIEEVPWWIQKFSLLHRLTMSGCNKLRCVSLHISKLNYLETVDFSDCGSLTEASWDDGASVVAMATDNIHSKVPVLESSSSFPDNFINCFNFNFNLDQKPILWPQTDTKNVRLSGDEVFSYFTHRTTGTSSSLADIPLLQTSSCQPFFRFKACAKVDSISSRFHEAFKFNIQVSCRFKGRHGNHFDSPYRLHKFNKRKGIHLIIFECCFSLNEDNAYHHVDIKFHLVNHMDSTSILKGWGIRLSDDIPSPETENQLAKPNTLPQVRDNEQQQTDTAYNKNTQETNNSAMHQNPRGMSV